MFEKVAIVGGTHGNEYTGAYLIKFLEENSGEIFKNYSFPIKTILGNPEAFKANRRFIEEDLNRSFIDKNFKGEGTSLEAKRALEMKKECEQEKIDFLIDLHTTTSNMKKTVIISRNDVLSFACGQYLHDNVSNVKIIINDRMDEDSYLVNRIAPSGLLIEVGPTPQGVLRGDIYQWTQEILNGTLEFLEKVKSKEITLKESQDDYNFERYKEIEMVQYPLTKSGELAGLVHPDLQDKDFELIEKGHPLFLLFNGSIITYQEDEPFYPIFINEGAYYPKKLAFTKTRKINP